VLTSGQVTSQVTRKDTDFDEMHKYLEVKYPGVLIPTLLPSE